MKTAFRLVMAGLMLISSGCAFNTSTLHLDYKAPVYAEKVTFEKSIDVQPLNDIRGGDPFPISYKGVEFKTTGTYLADEKIADIITDDIKTNLTNLNYKIVASQGDLILAGELAKLDSTFISGVLTADLNCTILISLKLTDAKTGHLVWSEMLTGFQKRSEERRVGKEC